ncbi:hypothetical protein MIR68_003119 [Amoeboaphelidium protococcarum]|nr:hypothetical protein MIR68_003119 [Amoeboaphelidium protococcarum]
MTTGESENSKGGLSHAEQEALLNYTWKQTLNEVDLCFPLGSAIQLKGRDFSIDIKKKSLKVALKDKSRVLAEGELYGEILIDDSTWTLMNTAAGQVLDIHLEKATSASMKWWPHVLTHEPQLDTSKIEPENSKLSDLDGETRAVVEKMMVEQRAKAAGQSAVDDSERKKMEMLEKFKAQHPEMDFSNAKFS